MLKVAIVGRPNVGKSTLFNRLAGKQLAIVHDQPGVTRDRREGEGRIGPLYFQIIDTPGLDEGDHDSLEQRMMVQTTAAVKEADVCVMVLDGSAGVTPQDNFFASWLRPFGKPVVLVANKCERKDAALQAISDCYSLGLGEPVCISAVHGEGMSDLYDALAVYETPQPEAEDLSESDEEAKGPKPIQLAVIGRPNAGKSTLINALVGEDRLLTGPEAGLTRDAIGIDWDYHGTPMKLVDTAGMRRRTRVEEGLERMAVGDTLRTMRFAQVVVVVMSAENPLEKQDLTIARLVIEEGRSLVIALNKWDLVRKEKEYLEAFHDRLSITLPQVRGIPVVPISAAKGKNLNELMQAVLEIYDVWNRKVSTSHLNTWLKDATERHPPPLVRGRRLRLKYMTQTKTRPPTFLIFSTLPEKLPDDYLRFLINDMREAFNLPGVPIRLSLRKPDNPYADD